MHSLVQRIVDRIDSLASQMSSESPLMKIPQSRLLGLLLLQEKGRGQRHQWHHRWMDGTLWKEWMKEEWMWKEPRDWQADNYGVAKRKKAEAEARIEAEKAAEGARKKQTLDGDQAFSWQSWRVVLEMNKEIRKDANLNLTFEAHFVYLFCFLQFCRIKR